MGEHGCEPTDRGAKRSASEFSLAQKAGVLVSRTQDALANGPLHYECSVSRQKRGERE
jgi:hypothetical protein